MLSLLIANNHAACFPLNVDVGALALLDGAALTNGCGAKGQSDPRERHRHVIRNAFFVAVSGSSCHPAIERPIDFEQSHAAAEEQKPHFHF